MIETVAQGDGFTIAELFARKRSRTLARERAKCWAIARAVTGQGFLRVGKESPREFDHTTIMAGYKLWLRAFSAEQRSDLIEHYTRLFNGDSVGEPPHRTPPVRSILFDVADALEIDPQLALSLRTRGEACKARDRILPVVRELSGCSYPELGAACGMRHSGCMSSVSRGRRRGTFPFDIAKARERIFGKSALSLDKGR